MKYHFKVHKEKSGYWAEGVEITWAHTQGNTLEELRANMKEVLELCLEEPNRGSSFVPPLPDPSVRGRNIAEVAPDPSIAMAVLLRRSRIKSRMSQRQTALKLGIKHFSQYQRLEKGETANPELRTLANLKKLFPKFSVDAVLT